MIRYNAAHRVAERDIFPVTRQIEMPVIAYTATRWGTLFRANPEDPRWYEAPRASDWYRFVLHEPAVSIVLCAPDKRAELEEDLTVLSAAGPLAPEEHARLAEHGARVKRNAGQFE